MKELKIIAAIGLLIALSVLITVIAYASLANASRTATPAAYNSYAPGSSHGNYPYYGNSQYPTYPTTPVYPAYPTQPNGPVYPQQPVYPYNQPGYGYPYGSYGEREIGPWGGE